METALTISRDFENLRLQGDVRFNLGVALESAGDRIKAIELFEEAQGLFEEVGDLRAPGLKQLLADFGEAPVDE